METGKQAINERKENCNIGYIESAQQNLLHRAMDKGEDTCNSANITVDDFKVFCGVFVPFYLEKCLKKGSAMVFSKLSDFRSALKGKYPNEANRLTEPFLEFVRPYLTELNIFVLYDKVHSCRTDRIAFTRSSYLIEEEKVIRLKHYLFDNDIYVPKVFCSECVGSSASCFPHKCTKTPLPAPAHLCELFEPKENI